VSDHPKHDQYAELYALLDTLRDGDLTDEQVERLDALLEGDDEAQQIYVDYLDVCASLRHYHGTDVVLIDSEPVPWWRRHNVLIFDPPLAGLAAAAVLGVLVTIGAMFLFNNGNGDPRPTFTDEPGFAVLTRAVDTVWGAGTPTREAGETLAAGDLTLDRGVAQIEFYSGATVVVEAPAKLQLVSADRAVVHHGKVHASVPPQAHGFTLNAADVDVVDLGTEFALNVTDAGTEVHVFDGEVELQHPDKTIPTGDLITKGKGVRIDPTGVRSDIAPDARAFVSPATLAGLADADGVRRMREWTRYTDTLRADPDVLVCFTFDNQQSWERRLINRAIDTGDDPATVAPDASIIGAQWAEGRWPGKGALEFKRASDRVRITVPGEHDAMTLAAWVRIDGFDRQWNSLMLTDGWKRGDPHWQVSWDGEIILGVHTGRTVNYFSPKGVLGPADLGRWMHLVTVYDGEARLTTHYLDGRVVSSEPITDYIPLSVNAAEIGNWQTASKSGSALRNLNGRIDEFTILDRALDAREVEKMFLAGKP